MKRLIAMAAVFASAAPAQETSTQAPPQTIQGLDNFSIERPAPARPDTAATPVPVPAAPVIALPSPAAAPIVRAVQPQRQSLPTVAATPTPIATPDVAAVTPAVEASPAPVATPSIPPVTGDSWSWWWALGLLLLAALGCTLAFWWRSRGEIAVEERVEEPVEEPVEEVAPPPLPVEPVAPVPAAPTPALGFITSNLRAQVGLAFYATRVSVDTLRVQLDYEVVISNTGAAKSRELFVELAMLSAGTVQDAALAAFYASAPGEPIAESDGLAAGAWARLGGEALLPRDAFDVISAGGRQMFVPLMAARVLGPTGAIVAKGAWLVGIEREGEVRMAPLRFDRAVQVSLGMRAYP